MRINFGSTYKEVEQLLKGSLKPNSKADDAAFEKSLGDLLLQPIDSPAESPPPLSNSTFSQPAKSSMEEVKASYRFHDPSLMMPDLVPIVPEEVEPVPSEIGGMSVKTPTPIEARRVTLEPTRMMSGLQPQVSSLSTLLPKEPELLQSLAPLNVPSGTSPLSASASPLPPFESVLPSPLNKMPPQLNQKEIASRISLASQKMGLDPALTMSVVNAESGFNVRAVSADGHNSKGLFQLLDSTGKTLLSRAGDDAREYDPFDPDLNTELGTSYLRYLHDIFKTSTQLTGSRMTKSAADEQSLEQLAVAAFNAGEGRVASAQHRTEQAGKDPAHYDNVAPFLPRSTREYVARVVRGKRLF
jgi:soluble lytic murein transglycosylase-like protein